MRLPFTRLGSRRLAALSRASSWSLDAKELEAVQRHFRKLGREPTQAELETLAQTWSEHCKHKTLAGPIHYKERGPRGLKVRRFRNLLKETIFDATRRLRSPACLSVFKDNAGIVALDRRWALAFKVETHNHPSAIEPYGGAATGVGGVIRDVLGAGLGARPILNTDVFCVGPLDHGGAVPEGLFHPRRVLRQVVAGVRDYGNRMGIPTASGGLVFDPGYLLSPLVFCGTVGILPRRFVRKSVREGDLVVAVGGRTGRDGLHGATFSSAAMDESAAVGVVQIGNAIQEKKFLDVLLQARDRGLYRALTDCGAGGFSSAVGELGAELGAEVQLERVPLKQQGLQPWEIWLSESQERMLLAVPPAKWPALQALFEAEDVEAAVLGAFKKTGRLRVTFHGEAVVDLSMKFLHHGLPRTERKAMWSEPETRLGIVDTQPGGVGRGLAEHRPQRQPAEGRLGALPGPQGVSGPKDTEGFPRSAGRRPAGGPERRAARTECSEAPLGPGLATYNGFAQVQGENLGSVLKSLLAHPNVCSREWIIRQYDHEVQGQTIGKPLAGPGGGPSDACVLWPITATGDRNIPGVAVASGMCTGAADPYRRAVAAVDEALRNLAAVGADIRRAALLDNFCWGDVSDPRELGGLVRALLGCRDAALGYRVPFISGKDSLNNAYAGSDGKRRSIPGTLLISGLAPVPDIRRRTSMELKAPGHVLWLVGPAAEGFAFSREVLEALYKAIGQGLILACHDLSEGGLAVAAAEMAFSGGVGIELDLGGLAALTESEALFSEGLTRFLVEAAPGEALARRLQAVQAVPVGRTLIEPVLRARSPEGRSVLEESLQDLRQAWAGTLPRLLDGEPESVELEAVR